MAWQPSQIKHNGRYPISQVIPTINPALLQRRTLEVAPSPPFIMNADFEATSAHIEPFFTDQADYPMQTLGNNHPLIDQDLSDVTLYANEHPLPAHNYEHGPSRKRPTTESISFREGPQMKRSKGTGNDTHDGLLNKEAVRMCMTWLTCYPDAFPEKRHIDALCILTDQPSSAIKRWFGSRMRSGGVSSHDSGYGSGSTSSTQMAESQPLVAGGGCTLVTSAHDNSWEGSSGNRTIQLSEHSRGINHQLTNTELTASLSLMSGNESANDAKGLGSGAAETDSDIYKIALAKAAERARNRKSRLGNNCKETADLMLMKRDPSRPFQCTGKCGKKFARKGDWKRHENARFPQHGWLCMVGRVATVNGIKLCAYCPKDRPTPNPTFDHVKIEHRKCLRYCQEGKYNFCQRDFYRRQHFEQHFSQVHPGLRPEDYAKKSHFKVHNSAFPKFCGFCTYQFTSWNERIDHISKHFTDDQLDMLQWRDPIPLGETEDESFYNHDYDSDHDSDDGDSDDGDQDDNDYENDNQENPHDYTSELAGLGPPYGSSKSPSSANRMSNQSQWSSPCDAQDNEILSLSTRLSLVCISEKSNEVTRLVHANEIALVEAPPSNQPKNESDHIGEERGFSSDMLMIREDSAGIKHCRRALLDSASTMNIISLESVRLLGVGSFGIVDEVLCQRTQQRFARKIFVRSKDARRHFAKEVTAISQLQHPHIVGFFGAYEWFSSPCLLLRPIADGTLAEYLNRPVNTPGQSARIMQKLGCLASAIEYIHNGTGNRFPGFHADIKPQNILVAPPDEKWVIGDFGLSKFSQAELCTRFRQGTRIYSAPETWSDRPLVSMAADIWSLGCVFSEALSWSVDRYRDYKDFQQRHFEDDKSYRSNRCQVLKWLERLKSELKNDDLANVATIASMMAVDPFDRPTAAQVCNSFPPGSCCSGSKRNKTEQIDSGNPRLLSTNRGGSWQCSVRDSSLNNVYLTYVDDLETKFDHHRVTEQLSDYNRVAADVESEELGLPLWSAVLNRDREAIERFLEAGTDAEKQSSYVCIHRALSVKTDHLEVVNLLLKNGANATIESDTRWPSSIDQQSSCRCVHNLILSDNDRSNSCDISLIKRDHLHHNFAPDPSAGLRAAPDRGGQNIGKWLRGITSWESKIEPHISLNTRPGSGNEPLGDDFDKLEKALNSCLDVFWAQLVSPTESERQQLWCQQPTQFMYPHHSGNGYWISINNSNNNRSSCGGRISETLRKSSREDAPRTLPGPPLPKRSAPGLTWSRRRLKPPSIPLTTSAQLSRIQVASYPNQCDIFGNNPGHFLASSGPTMSNIGALNKVGTDSFKKNLAGETFLRALDPSSLNDSLERRISRCVWMAEQCHKLALALMCVHNEREIHLPSFPDLENEHDLYGRHGDIKTDNVLWYQRVKNDILVLADFGLGRLHIKISRSNETPKYLERSATYRAPEFDTEEGRISRACDIFSLGCMFLEFVIWYLEGFNSAQEDFANHRLEPDKFNFMADTFFWIETGPGDMRKPIIKPQVVEWIQRLKRN